VAGFLPQPASSPVTITAEARVFTPPLCRCSSAASNSALDLCARGRKRSAPACSKSLWGDDRCVPSTYFMVTVLWEVC
jgi:hypothetical protein